MSRRVTIKKVDSRAKFVPKTPWKTPKNQYTNVVAETRFKKAIPGDVVRLRGYVPKKSSSGWHERDHVANFYSYEPRKKSLALKVHWRQYDGQGQFVGEFKTVRVMTLQEAVEDHLEES